MMLTMNLAPDFPNPASHVVQEAIPRSQPIMPVATMPMTTTKYPKEPEMIADHIGIASASNAPSRNAGTHTQIPACTNAMEIQPLRSSCPIGFKAVVSCCFLFFSILFL